MKNLLRLTIFFVVSALFLSFKAFAASHQPPSYYNKPGAFTLTPYLSVLVFDHRRDFDSVAMPGVSLAYNWTPHWTSEFYFGHFSTDTRGTFKTDVDGEYYLLDGVYHFRPEHRFQPLMFAGVGMTSIDPNGNITAARPSGDKPRYQTNINGGVGAEYYVNPYISVRTDVRDVFTFSGGRHDILANFGVGFHFGGNSTLKSRGAMPDQSCLGKQATVLFAIDSSRVSAASRNQLQHVANCLHRFPQLKANINGYTSNTGGQAYNHALSQRRARAVKSALNQRYGVLSSRLHAHSFGEHDPVASNNNATGRAQNRRVETIVVSMHN